MNGVVGRSLVVATLLALASAAPGAGASTGSQSATIAVLVRTEVTVLRGQTTLSVAPGSCATAPATINVRSNVPYNVRIRSGAWAAGRAPASAGPFVVVEIASIVQPGAAAAASADALERPAEWSAGAAFAALSAAGADLFGAPQTKTTNAGTNHVVSYRQCVTARDAAGTYALTVGFEPVQLRAGP